MTIYFLGALSEVQEMGPYYTRQVEELEKEGNKVISDHILGVNRETVRNLSLNQRTQYFVKMLNRIKNCDLMFVDLTKPTVNIGHEIALAIQNEKPILGLYKGLDPSSDFPILFGSGYDKLVLLDYNKHNLEQRIKKGFQKIRESLDVRFNFFIPPKIAHFLDMVSQRDRISKSVYLRNLIEKDMRAEEDFNK